MTTITQMPCPRCGVHLEERTVRSVTVHGCGTCGGVWLDKKQASVVLSRVGALQLVLASERVARSATSAAKGTRTARCPLDAEPLNLVETDGVEVDVCPVHGTWFDAGEVHRIANAHCAQQQGGRSSPGPRWTASEPVLGTDVIDQFFGLLD